jgi:hypothetical protein
MRRVVGPTWLAHVVLLMARVSRAGNAQAGAVIGKGGEGIKMIRARAGATVKVASATDMPPGVRTHAGPLLP